MSVSLSGRPSPRAHAAPFAARGAGETETSDITPAPGDGPPRSRPGGEALIARRLARGQLEPEGEPVTRGGALVQAVSGDGFFGGRAEVVANTEQGRAHLVQRGFLQRYDAPVHADTDTAWRDVLGPPRDEERKDAIGRVVQHFERGTLWWTPEAGIHGAVHGATTPRRGLDAAAYCGRMLGAEDFSVSEGYAFRNWAMKQAGRNRHIGAVYRAVEDILCSDRRPGSVRGLFDRARQAAAASLTTDPDLPTERLARSRTITLVALVGLAAHALQNHHFESTVSSLFPPYLPDGRPGETAADRAWHVFNHAMLAFAWLYAREYGPSELADAFSRHVAEADAGGASGVVKALYHEVEGRVGSVLPGTVPGPPDAGGSYAPEPELEDPTSQEAFDLAVRIGYAYELAATPREGLGTNRDQWDPVAEIDATHHFTSGVGDPNWVGDVSSNIRGAAAGVALFERGDRTFELPDDVGFSFSAQTYAPARAVPADHFLATEHTMLDRLGDPEADPEVAFAAHRAAAEADLDGARGALRARISAAVDALTASDGDRLARYYAAFVVRTLTYVGRFEGSWDESPTWRDHYAWARDADPEAIRHGFDRRLDALASRFDTGA